MTINEINIELKSMSDIGNVSDGYHTFNELYDHRIALYIALCNSLCDEYFVWRSVTHSDGSMFDGWFVLGINENPGEQITYHLPMSVWDKCRFALTPSKVPEFDGHTSEDVLKRIASL